MWGRSVAGIWIVQAASGEGHKLMILMRARSRECIIRMGIHMLSLFRFLELIRGMLLHRTGACVNGRSIEALYSLKVVAICISEGLVQLFGLFSWELVFELSELVRAISRGP